MISIERIRQQFEELPPEKQEEVADFIAYLSARYARGDGQRRAGVLRHAGRLKASSSLNEDPVALQRNLRDEW